MTDGSTFATSPSLLRALGKRWWLFLLRGIVGIAFGILALLWPGLALLTLALVWGAYALVDGAFALAASLSGMRSGDTPRWWLALTGLAGIAAGLLTIIWPGITVQVLLLLIAAWAIVTGAMEAAGAIALRKEIEGELFLILAGLVSIGFGVAILAWPVAGAIGLVWLIAWLAILGGAAYVALALRLRKLAG
ncbi:HdeD family acid-resistance protein [Sphingomonas sp. NPDC092331]|jgi:uncharacterized membrane protein HdeD (DUF308 family)|uniref:HdeD family acid-resistance protein n=1 Tax=unclassified Sphingomonas TaxID=196159 RepID=UPI00245675BE|nr:MULTISPECIES: HdeD family acid-resistance protein [unclassified Sphingomonas]MBQ1498446.1 HdeD family acid-resistance protein [Sphingomonas sp.]MCH7860910.1 HdeD family acid-resistance protein [Pseudomonadota bacterium]MDH4744352.1 HdeD family acid-resistance protein [Sphingomonas sp. CBMAI 2297]